MAETAPTPAAAPHPDNVLVLGKVALILEKNELIVKDKALTKRHRQKKICGIPVGSCPTELPIPFYNILWAELMQNSIVAIAFASVSKKHTRPVQLQYEIPAADCSIDRTQAWIERLFQKAYANGAQQQKRAKVIVNPHAGPGGADKTWEQDVKPLFEAAHMQLDVVRTSFSGEAIGICEHLDISAFDIVIPCSGDGLPYECFNGFAKRPDARRALHQVAVAHIPCGSGNAMSCNLYGTHYPSVAALAIIKGVRMPMDLVSITQGETRSLSFLSQALGIIADGDLGTEHLRWMGAKRFDVGVVQRIFSKKTYPVELSVKVGITSKEDIKAHYKREQRDGDFTLRREDYATGTGSSTASTSSASNNDGLPPLKFGTVNDKIPDDWQTASLDTMGNFYCGNMAYMAPNANFFAAACANDGLMDLVTNEGNLSIAKYLGLMTSIEDGSFFTNDLISYRKVLAYRITPRQQDGYISIDGEKVPFKPFQAEIHPGLGTVISKNGRYEANGPPGWQYAED